MAREIIVPVSESIVRNNDALVNGLSLLSILGYDLDDLKNREDLSQMVRQSKEGVSSATIIVDDDENLQV